MTTLIFRLFWRLMRSTFSSLKRAEQIDLWPVYLRSAAVLSSVSTKHRFGNSSNCR